MKIYKYEIALDDVQLLAVPRCWRPLAVQLQGETLCIWAEVDEDTYKKQAVKILIRGTGEKFVRGVEKYIGTVQKDGFVWHFYCDGGQEINQ